MSQADSLSWELLWLNNDSHQCTNLLTHLNGSSWLSLAWEWAITAYWKEMKFIGFYRNIQTTVNDGNIYNSLSGTDLTCLLRTGSSLETKSNYFDFFWFSNEEPKNHEHSLSSLPNLPTTNTTTKKAFFQCGFLITMDLFTWKLWEPCAFMRSHFHIIFCIVMINSAMSSAEHMPSAKYSILLQSYKNVF